MSENENSYRPLGQSPLRRNRPSPRKHPYERHHILGGVAGIHPPPTATTTATTKNKETTVTTITTSSYSTKTMTSATTNTTIVRSPLKNIQAPIGLRVRGQGQGPPQLPQLHVQKVVEKVKVKEDEQPQPQPEQSASTTTSSWNPFFSTSLNVTVGVLGALQPRGLNSSFTEKFQSRLGINSGGLSTKSASPKKENKAEDDKNRKRKMGEEEGDGMNMNDENAAPPSPGGNKVHPHAHHQRVPFGGRGGGGLLSERISPLFDCPEYIREILGYWAQLEIKYKIKWDYMERHTGISHKMRTILVDWLAEVVSEYDLNEETLHLAVNYIDRFLCRMNVKRTKLQLVGTAALFIAAKFEETNPPEISDFVYVTDEAYTKHEILGMENLMLTCLEFDLMMPTAHNLALSYCSLLGLTDPTRSMIMYLIDLSLLDGEIFLKILPSVLAAAAVALARFSFGGTFWDVALQKHCGHRMSTIIPGVRALHSAFFDAPSKSQTTIYEKYSTVRHCSVAKAFIPNNGPWDVDV